MLALHLLPDGAQRLDEACTTMPAAGWVWVDVLHEELSEGPEPLRDLILRLTGVRVFDLHLQDALNLAHPSFFDSTQDYEVVIFRKLIGESAGSTAGAPVGKANDRRMLRGVPTGPITFFAFERVLVTVHGNASRTIEQVRTRLLEFRSREGGNGGDKQRLPARPEELMLRLLNAMVDRYLELRQPLTAQLDRWQRELLDPRRPFDNWVALLDSRNEVRKLEYLCEEQYDALQELRDHYLETTPEAAKNDAHLVRIADVMEHITRVLNHSRRLEASIESAVQLHFSAMSHRTNRNMQTLTVITAIFAPLTLITGIFGMNFEVMPLLKDAQGFWILLVAMGALSVAMGGAMLLRRYLSHRRAS